MSSAIFSGQRSHSHERIQQSRGRVVGKPSNWIKPPSAGGQLLYDGASGSKHQKKVRRRWSWLSRTRCPSSCSR